MHKIVSVLFLFCLSANLLKAQTNGTLSVSVTTSSTGGNYAPRNVLAIWVEDSSGKFVKTLLAYAGTRKIHLNTWETATTAAGSVYNTIDAVTGSTQQSHATRTCQWNGTDYNGKLMADGNYKVWMELTDKNATGNVTSFTIAKGPVNQKYTPANVPSFSSITLNWSATVTGINPELTTSNTVVIYPNPGTGVFTVLGENILNIKVSDIGGKLIYSGTTPVFDISGHPSGIYLVSVKTDKEIVIERIIKK